MIVWVRVRVMIRVRARVRDQIIQHILVRGPLTPPRSGEKVLLGITADCVVGSVECCCGGVLWACVWGYLAFEEDFMKMSGVEGTEV
eukprot:1373442-Amorphochlora_amoeboformis.AAC.1